MKRKIYIIASVIVILVASLFLIIKLSNDSKTVEEAIATFESKPINIIHEEKTNKGSMVFYNHLGLGDFSTAFVKKGIGGYKVVYNGAEADVKTVSKRIGLSYNYYPYIRNKLTPMYFGVIGNPEITQVKVIEKKRNIEYQAKIINAKGMRIWLVFLDNFKEPDFKIVGFSLEGKELTDIDDNI